MKRRGLLDLPGLRVQDLVVARGGPRPEGVGIPGTPLAVKDPPLAGLLAPLSSDRGLHRISVEGHVNADAALGAVDESLGNELDVKVSVELDLTLDNEEIRLRRRRSSELGVGEQRHLSVELIL